MDIDGIRKITFLDVLKELNSGTGCGFIDDETLRYCVD